MYTWFKKFFGSKCSCDHCGSCGKNCEDKKPVEAAKTETGQPENVEKK